MPFKTRRQKLNASQRRFSYNSIGNSVSYEEVHRKHETGDLKPNGPISVPEKASDAIEKPDYLKKDVVKILLGSSVILAAQIVLSLTLP